MHDTSVSDEQLIRNYINGDQQSFSTLLRRHKRKVYGYIYVSVKNADVADDIFQDAFYKVINTIRTGSYREEGKFIQWLMRISHNLIIDYFRQQSKYPMAQSQDDRDIFETVKLFDANAEDKMIQHQTHSTLRALIEELPSEQREVLKMRIYNEMSFKDIADSTNVSINTALGRMRYALINLRKSIQEKQPSILT